MPYLILALVVAGVLFAPQIWVRRMLTKHAAERPDMPGTGSELARHLLDEAGLQTVRVEQTQEGGDHYDPEARVVRLSPGHHGGRSIAAVAVAAHEVAHAVQHARGEPLFAWRGRLVRLLIGMESVTTFLTFASALFIIVARSPWVLAIGAVLIVGLFALRIIVHLVTLPVEMDASFGKALPVLERGRYLDARDMPAARQVLRAAALTYVAAALASLLDILRFMRFGR
jgi:uncharacterized protein